MIYPTDVRIAPPIPQAELDALEQQFDNAIIEAERTGKWPAKVYTARDLATPAGIRATIERYRDAHWSVVEGSGDVRATIDHPNRVREERQRRVGSLVLG